MWRSYGHGVDQDVALTKFGFVPTVLSLFETRSEEYLRVRLDPVGGVTTAVSQTSGVRDKMCVGQF
jgi:hypothetical protein